MPTAAATGIIRFQGRPSPKRGKTATTDAVAKAAARNRNGNAAGTYLRMAQICVGVICGESRYKAVPAPATVSTSTTAGSGLATSRCNSRPTPTMASTIVIPPRYHVTHVIVCSE